METAPGTSERRSGDGGYRLSSLRVYPIKSAAGMAVNAWPLGPNGLLLDREWAVVGPTGKPVSPQSIGAIRRRERASGQCATVHGDRLDSRSAAAVSGPS